MELGWLDFLWKVVITILNFAGWVWMYLSSRDKVTNARISTLQEEIDVKLDDHGTRLTSLERTQELGPTHEDLGKLHGRIDELSSLLKRSEGESNAQTRILNLVYESLIKR